MPQLGHHGYGGRKVFRKPSRKPSRGRNRSLRSRAKARTKYRSMKGRSVKPSGMRKAPKWKRSSLGRKYRRR